MKIVSNNYLDEKYLRAVDRYSLLATLFAAVVIAANFLVLLLNGENQQTPFTNSIVPVTIFFSALGALLVARHARSGPLQLDRHYSIAWLCMSVGLFVSGLGVTIFGLLQDKAPSLFSSGYGIITLIFYPLTCIGLFLLPSSPRIRISAVFDVLITSFCLLGVFWFFVTNTPATLHMNTLLTGDMFFLLYPCCDIFLLFVLFLFFEQGVESTWRPAYMLLGLGLLASLFTHVAIVYTSIFANTSRGIISYIDLFWLAGLLLIGLATVYQYTALAHHVEKEQGQQHTALTTINLPEGGKTRSEQNFLRSWLRVQNMYIPLALFICCLVFYYMLHQQQVPGTFLFLTVCTSILIVVRHFFASRENNLLLREREQRYDIAEHVRALVSQLSDIQSFDSLCDRFVQIAVHDFGFTFAMLLLVEEYNSPLTSQSHILVNTTSLSTHPTRWRLRGDTILYRTVAMGKRVTVDWDVHTADTPAEVRVWLSKQHFPAMVFFPILYRDKILGSLGVARHVLSQRSQSEAIVVRVFTEQIAALIEHAYLYREARDHEAFALAMATISKRLNAVVVELTEISKLICEEGVRALPADYAVLYAVQDNASFVPLATSQYNDDLITTLQQWPGFSLTEYEAETDKARHPFLLDMAQRGREHSQGKPGRNSRPELRVPSLRAKLARHFVQTAILAPLVSGGQLIGLLLFARVTAPGLSNDFCFDVQDLPHAQDFVEQAGIAFANARLYEHLRSTHERLKELDQLKDQFMVTASHELRTPLTAVQGYIELMAQYDDVLQPEQRREFLHKAQMGCEELAVLLRNVMDASRLEIEAGIKQSLLSRINVKEMIQKVQVMIEPQVKHEHRNVTIEVPAHLHVHADPVRLHQVLLNISSNALKYSSPGSPITFSARLSSGQEQAVVISIKDRGKGIMPEDQVNLFQRFVRLESDLNSPVRGSGLGLYISRRLIEAMEGKIWIESRGIPGEGSTFHIQLPAA